MNNQEVTFVEPLDIHDGTALSVHSGLDDSTVSVRSYEGRQFAIRFRDVREVKANNPEGMSLYALMELPSDRERRYVFANWDGDAPPSLEEVRSGNMRI
jgi:hypothetical protein